MFANVHGEVVRERRLAGEIDAVNCNSCGMLQFDADDRFRKIGQEYSMFAVRFGHEKGFRRKDSRP